MSALRMQVLEEKAFIAAHRMAAGLSGSAAWAMTVFLEGNSALAPTGQWCFLKKETALAR